MPAFMIFTREGPVTDQAEMDEYSRLNQAHAAHYVANHKMRPLVIYGEQSCFEGEAPDGVVMLEFPTAQDARNWYDSPEYREAMAHRLKGANYRVVLVEGI